MGQEIDRGHFIKKDFNQFEQRVRAETEYLRGLFDNHALSTRQHVAGFELEAWLVDDKAGPAPINEQYLARLDNELVVAELARFNVELNGSPLPLHGKAMSNMHAELAGTWDMCRRNAIGMDAELVMAGILPTVRDAHLILENMSRMKRYAALNEQVMRLRRGRPLQLDIRGKQHLQSTHYDVMLESAATSFQLHIQVPWDKAVRYYNASQILAAPLVAISANSPYLFGRDLWDETRVPLFEQAVEVGGLGGAAFGPLRRVTFGSGYARESLMEIFAENQEHYPILLPMELSDDVATMSHLRLHNGTIWRWNRPLIGFDEDGTPHLRIEHRVIPAGPTIMDAFANATFFYALIEMLVNSDIPMENQIDFATARDNFYAAARKGLNANFTWQGKSAGATTILHDVLLPLAWQGIDRLQLDLDDAKQYLGIIEARLRTGRNGAHWQRAFVAEHGDDMHQLTREYLARQTTGAPVHEWLV